MTQQGDPRGGATTRAEFMDQVMRQAVPPDGWVGDDDHNGTGGTP